MSLVSINLTVFLKSVRNAQISKTLTPSDLENEKSGKVIDIAIKTPVHKIDKPRPNGFLGNCPQIFNDPSYFLVNSNETILIHVYIINVE